MNRFIVALNGGSRDQRNALTALFQAKAWPVWHYFEDLWLLSEIPENVTAKSLHSELEKIAVIGEHSIVILKIAEGQHEFYGRANPEGWEWMKKSWGKVSS